MADPGTQQQWLSPEVLAGMGLPAPVAPGLPDASAPPSIPLPAGQPPPLDASLAGAPSPLPPSVMQAVQSGFAPTPPAQLPNPAAAPTVPPAPVYDANVPTTPQQVAASNKAYDQRQAQQAAVAASPEGGQQAAATAEAGDVNKQADATTKQGDIAAKQADEEYALRLQAAKDAQEKAAKNAQEKAARDAEVKQHFDELIKADKEAQDAKVDPNRAWNKLGTGGKIGAALSMILSGIGVGLNHGQGQNLAMKMIDDATANDVDAQKANIEQLNKSVDHKKAIYEMSRDNAKDANEETEKARAQALSQVNEQLLTLGAKYKGPLQQAAASQASAEILQKRDAIYAGLADKRVAQKHQDAQLANERAQTAIDGGKLALASQAQAHAFKDDDRNFDEKKREFDATMAKDYATAKNSGDVAKAAQIKNVMEHGVGDTLTGAPILTKAGEQKMAQADGLEVALRNAKSPQERDAILVSSAPKDASGNPMLPEQIREQAKTQNAFLTEDAKEIKPKVAAAQNLITGLQGALDDLEKDPSSFDRAAYQKIVTQIEDAKKADLELNGSKFSSKTIDAMGKGFGPDLGDFAPRIAPGKIKAALEQTMADARSSINATLRSQLYDGTAFKVRAPGPTSDVVKGTTAAEAGEKAKPGLIGQGARYLVHHVAYPLSKRETSEDIADNAANEVKQGPTGLTPEDTAKVATQIATFATIPDAAREKIVADLAQDVASERPSIANGTLGLVRQNPEVYARVLAKLPPAKAAELRQFDADAKAVAPSMPWASVMTQAGR